MEMEERREQSMTVLSPIGRLDGVGAPILEARVSEVTGRGESVMVLDCSRIPYVNSAGLRALLLSARMCQQEDGALLVAGLRPECKKVVEVSGLLTVIEDYETTAAAVRAQAGTERVEKRKLPERPDSRGMTIQEARNGSTVVLFPVGRLNSAGAEALERRVARIVARDSPLIVLDCIRMSYVNSSGLRALLLCARLCQQKEGKLVVAGLQPRCRSVIEMSGFLSVIEHYETSEAALAAIKP